jgi:hypothetical protein
LVSASESARADGALELLSPRAIGHAGASLVSEDGAAAAFICPAAIARRGGRRVQIAGLTIDDTVWLDTPDHPQIRDLGPADRIPIAGVQVGWDRVVIGVAVAVTEALDRQLPIPAADLFDPDVTADHPHRYAGQTAQWTRTSVGLTGAVRVTDWLALGATATLSRVDARESRRIWAGFAARDGAGSPARDVTVTIDAADAVVPGAAIGALIAPADVPIELALGAAWADDVRASGTAAATAARIQPMIAELAPSATGAFGSPLSVAIGVRWLGTRWAAEVGAAVRTYPTGQDAWSIQGIRVIDADGATASIVRLDSRFDHRFHSTARGAVDGELSPGFIWISAGWSWSRTNISPRDATTVGIDTGGHTFGFGIEASAGAAVLTLGIAHQLARLATVDTPELRYDNPFEPGTEPANLGSHGQRRTLIGFGVELAWE